MPGRHDVILGVEPGVKLDILESSGNAEFGQLIGAHAGDFSVEVDLALAGFVETIDAVEKSGFAGPIRANDGQDLILPDIQAHFIKGENTAKTEQQSVNLQSNLSIRFHL